MAAKRLHDAKFRLLERLRAQVHKMYEEGLILPATSTVLNDLVMDELDELDQAPTLT